MKKIFLTMKLVLTFESLFTIFVRSDSYPKNKIFLEKLYIRNIGNFGTVCSNASGGFLGYGFAFPEH